MNKAKVSIFRPSNSPPRAPLPPLGQSAMLSITSSSAPFFLRLPFARTHLYPACTAEPGSYWSGCRCYQRAISCALALLVTCAESSRPVASVK
eukprot:1159173-Pelagomonas_calceolata.AAC.2